MLVLKNIISNARLLFIALVLAFVAVAQIPGTAQASVASPDQGPCQHLVMMQDAGQAMLHSQADCAALGDSGSGMTGDCATVCTLTCTSAASSMFADQPTPHIVARGLAFEQIPHYLGSPAPLGSVAPPPRL